MDNEAQTTQIQDDNANIGAAEAHPKPMLNVDQQIAHMKAKGITFDLVSEAEAAAHLRTKCQFFRVYAYRRNFDRHVGGDRDGQYVGLDFGHLRVLSNLDRKLRDTLLPMALDLEHFAKVRLLAAAEDAGEDGYAVMRGYMASITDGRGHIWRGSSTGARTIPTRATSCTSTGTTCRSGPSARSSRSAPSSAS